MKKSVLLLDIDHTVINTDSMIDFLIYSLKTKTLKTLLKLPYIIIVIILYAFRIVSLKKAKEAVFYPIIDFSDKDLEDFFTKCLVPKINKSMEKVIKDAKDKNQYILMVTASPYAYMQYFKKYKYANEVIGTGLFYENSRHKNQIIGNNCKGEEKIVKIKEILLKNNIEIDFENSYAYSDSKSDMPMLRLVKHGFLVNKKNGEIVNEL